MSLGRRQSLLERLELYKRTPTFTETTVPRGLLKDHGTKQGVYGHIVVEAGQLALTVGEQRVVLEPGRSAVTLPQEVHAVEPLGAVRFHVEFYREPTDDGSA